MPVSELSRLSSSSFERLVRALAFRVFGPGGTVFSSGPDGARDFSIEGKIRGYEDREWNGYLVLQAKFRERLTGNGSGAGRDGDVDWLQVQIANEQKKYKDKARHLRRPDYYIVASNVALSGADGRGPRGIHRQGGHTKVAASLNGWKRALGLRDFDLWPADKIIDLLADAPNIRRSYAAWVTPGDVLAAALDQFKATTPNFSSLIRRALKKGLRRDQFARLKDAGNVVEDQIRTSQVFVDLPVNVGRTLQNPAAGVDACALSLLVGRAKDKLDSEGFGQDNETGDRSDTRILVRHSRVVLLGGPGQGKSTVATFTAQLFRATLLVDDPTTDRDPTVSSIVPEVLRRADVENIPDSLPRRYPVLVSLPKYADAISAARTDGRDIPSLLSQIASDLSRAADEPVDRSDLRLWLAEYPWLLVLDGLDEVPPSGERRAVVEAIADIQTEISDTDADVLLVVTTRPQGYNRDLDPEYWDHWYLTDMPPLRALSYAQALGQARYPDDPDRRDDLLRALRDASTRPATSRLMVNPLQVTIMHMIADTGGSVPPARWSLFNEYFEILRRREKAKGGETQRAIERNWTLLGPIHQRAGLILHTDSEIKGGPTRPWTTIDSNNFYVTT